MYTYITYICLYELSNFQQINYLFLDARNTTNAHIQAVNSKLFFVF